MEDEVHVKAVGKMMFEIKLHDSTMLENHFLVKSRDYIHCFCWLFQRVGLHIYDIETLTHLCLFFRES